MEGGIRPYLDDARVVGMNREEFKTFTESELENVIKFAEKHTGRQLPRDYCFRWAFNGEIFCENIPEVIAQRVYGDEDHIRPCVDIVVTDFLDDRRLIIDGIVAGYAARPFGKNWTGNEGPFVYGVGQKLVDKLKGEQS